MSDQPPVIIFHASCLDGFGSAYAAYVHFERQRQITPDYCPAYHGDQPPDVSGRQVYVLDYAYQREPMTRLCQQASAVVVLDHHITAQENLQGLEQECPNLALNLDMSRSGAMMAWQHFHSEPAPALIECVQDRDLWLWERADSQDVNAALMSYPFNFERWHQWATDPVAFQQLVTEGRTINRYRAQMIAQHKRGAVMGTIAGYPVPVVNCPRAIVSELVGELAEGHPFAAGYTDKGLVRSWSLRSSDDGEDVAQVAQRFGGGGHRNAAGFVTSLDPDTLSVKP